MIHLQLQGNHDQTGQQWGSLLRDSGVKILDHIPFPITGERIEYAEACLPVYRQYYPALLEELQGLAAGQDCDVQLLQAALFSMYAIPPACHCSCFAVAEGDEILFGRNSDFLPVLEEHNTNVIVHRIDGTCSFNRKYHIFPSDGGWRQSERAGGWTDLGEPDKNQTRL